MKKLMIAVAALSVGLAANAASVAWGGFVANEADAGETAQAGTVFNAIFIGNNNYSDLLSTFVYDTYTGLVGTGMGGDFVAAEGQTLLGTHTLTQEESDEYSFSGMIERADAAGGVNGNWLVTMYDATTPDKFWVGQYSVSGASDTSQAGSIRDEDWNIGYGMQEGVTSSHEVVPEPTSGLLLLIGMAGLALRRRRA